MLYRKCLKEALISTTKYLRLLKVLPLLKNLLNKAVIMDFSYKAVVVDPSYKAVVVDLSYKARSR